MLEFFLTFLVVYAAVVGLMVHYQRDILYFVRVIPESERQSYTAGYERVTVTTQDGIELHSYFRPPKSVGMPIILIFHGNASTAVWKADAMKAYADQGYGVWAAEYRGYDANPGAPSEEGLYRDAEAYMASERLTKTYAQSPLVIFGESLGSGVASEMAHRYPERCAGLILKVPFDSLLNVAKTRYPFILGMPYLLKDQYRSIEKLENWTMPKLILVAGRDEVVGPDGGRRLYDAAPEPKKLVVIDNARHNDIDEFGLEPYVFEFLAALKETSK